MVLVVLLKIAVNNILCTVHAKTEEGTDIHEGFGGRHNGFLAVSVIRIIITEYLVAA
jgi:hypothetical protein